MLKAIMVAYKRHLMYTKTLKELSNLSNRELYDLGIDRSDIERVASGSIDHKEEKIEFKFFKNLFKVSTEKDKIEDYLADSASFIDLENRLRDVENNRAPWQIRARNFSRGFI
jgi:uncharacterized protein YjiS (DUF1127 family)